MVNKQLAKRVKAIQKAFDDKDFIYQLLKGGLYDLQENFGEVFNYYLSTQDKNHKYTFQEIQDKLTIMRYAGNPLIDQRYYFQAYNGFCEDAYRANGLDDISAMDPNVKQAFELLEHELGKTKYGLGGEVSGINKSFITSDAETLMHYALNYSPERLWEGPLKEFKKTPIIVGEKKTEYMMRIIENEISSLPEISEEKKEKIRQAGRIVSEAYGSKRPRVAIIPESEIENYKANFDEKGERRLGQYEFKTIKELADEENPNWIYTFMSGNNMKCTERYSCIWKDYA